MMTRLLPFDSVMHRGHFFIKLYILYPFLWLSFLISAPDYRAYLAAIHFLGACPNHVNLLCAILSSNVFSGVDVRLHQ